MTSQLIERLERRAMLDGAAGTIWSGQYSSTTTAATVVLASAGTVRPLEPPPPPPIPRFEIFGTSANDTIVVRILDTLGKFTFTVNGKRRTNTAESIVISADAGDDNIVIERDPASIVPVTIYAAGGNDTIIGSTGKEKIWAGDGDDVVAAGNGNDNVYGEAGNDYLRGGAHNDRLDGGDGADTLRGDAGNDNICGGDGSDRLRGNIGNDTLDGGASRDYIGGEAGNDKLLGGGGQDALSGGEDDDTVDGGAGDDHCAGDAGHDNLAGGSGVDQLFGGEGTDHCATADDQRERADTDLADLAPPGGKFDLNNNQLVTNTPAGSASGGIYTGIQGTVQNAYNSGQWSQPGLTTSMPDTITGLTTIGVATGEQISGLGPTDTAIFGGHTITGTSTIAMYTYAGDANLDGMVDAADYEIIDAFAQIPGASGYANGDFNYNGVINGADYAIVDFSAAIQGPVQPAPSPPA